MQSYRWKFPLIAVIVAGFLAAWLGFDMTYGIDLKGGSVLIYDLDLSGIKNPTPAITKDTIEILQRRLDTLGLKEMSIRPAGDYQIMIQLPGVSEQSKEQIKDVIRKAGQLWFKIVVPPHLSGFDPAMISEIEEAKARGEYRSDEFEFDTAKVDTEREQQILTDVGLLARSGPPILLVRNAGAVDGTKLETAAPARDPDWGGPAIRFQMLREGRAALAAVTEQHVGGHMAIILDGVCVSAPRLKEALTGGTGIITGQFKAAEAESLVTVLRSGALKAKPILASENSVEATLGQESIRRGMIAVAASFAAVMAFMFVYYFGAGAVANLALLFNLVILMGIMSLFEATLTLPGIAGIVLTIGMAVDANILIYERIREEKRRGLPIRDSVDAGYDHAFWAIFDSNITTILTAMILYYVGTGPIRGFAVTLVIGIATSMFTALFVTRALFEYLTERGIVTEVRMLQLTERVPNFPFIAKRGPFVMLGVVLLNVGFLSFVARGSEKYGIDFNGGNALQLRFAQPLTKNDVEERLAKLEKPGPDGKPGHPYADAEVVRLGPAENERGAGRLFQVLISGHGDAERARPAPRKDASAATGSDRAHADEKPVDGDGEAPAAPETPQEIFVRDVTEAFRKELVPQAFTVFPPEATEGGKGRLTMRANVVPGETIDVEAARSALIDAGFAGAEVTPVEGSAVSVTAEVELEARAKERAEQAIKSVLEKKFPSKLSNPFPYKASIGSSVADTLKYRAVFAILCSLAMIILYVAFRFEFKMGIAATLCLFHDVLVTLGFMMLLDVTSPWTGIDAKQNLTTIAAYLTIVGYSINDTIVTFDRMRENLAKWTPGHHPEWKTYEDVLNASINQTLGRTILTSTTVFITLLVLAVAGVKSIQGFTLAMLIGVIAGTYSTIFIATPILLIQPRRLFTIVGIELGFFILAAVAAPLVRG